MAQCRGVLLLLSFAALLSCLDTSSAASVDATTTTEVDGVNVTVSNEVCEVAAWRVSFGSPSACLGTEIDTGCCTNSTTFE